ncbi:MAG: hypothetical protein LH650_03545, partial [Chloroflexi bacterium]|nr:hypothetical protein [Chloroflexota bacterium]
YEAVLGTGPGASRAESSVMASDLIPRTGGGITPAGGASGFPCPGDEAADPHIAPSLVQVGELPYRCREHTVTHPQADPTPIASRVPMVVCAACRKPLPLASATGLFVGSDPTAVSFVHQVGVVNSECLRQIITSPAADRRDIAA